MSENGVTKAASTSLLGGAVIAVVLGVSTWTEAPGDERTLRRGAPRSTIEFQELGAPPRHSEGELRTIAARQLDGAIDSMEVRVGTYEDRSGVSIPGSMRRELVCKVSGATIRVSGIRGEGEEPGFEVPVHLFIDDATGEFLAAATNSREEWVLPAVDDELSVRESEALAVRQFDMTITSPGVARQLSIDSVLEIVERQGFDVRGAGQVVIRPCTILYTLPAVRGSDGVARPDTTPHPYWVIEVLGSVTSTDDRASRWYSSGHLVFVNDAFPDVVMTYNLP